MRSQLRPALVSLGIFTILTGLLYPLVVTGLAQVLFPERASSTPGGGAAHRGPHPGAVGRTPCERPGSQPGS
jgi:K+-transporting ATPase ATPase C chain